MSEPVGAVTIWGIAPEQAAFGGQWLNPEGRCSQHAHRTKRATMLPPNNSSPTKTQRRKAATDSLDRNALPIAMPTNAATSAIIAGATIAPPSPLLRPSPSANAKVDTKAEIANACTNSSVPRLSACTYGTPGDDENSRRAVDESGCQTDQRSKQGFRAARDFEVDAAEANQGLG